MTILLHDSHKQAWYSSFQSSHQISCCIFFLLNLLYSFPQYSNYYINAIFLWNKAELGSNIFNPFLPLSDYLFIHAFHWQLKPIFFAINRLISPTNITHLNQRMFPNTIANLIYSCPSIASIKFRFIGVNFKFKNSQFYLFSGERLRWGIVYQNYLSIEFTFELVERCLKGKILKVDRNKLDKNLHLTRTKCSTTTNIKISYSKSTKNMDMMIEKNIYYHLKQIWEILTNKILE